MEEFDDDDFSDLYADVEVQASSAISALHRLTEMAPEGARIFDSATGGDEREGDEFTGAEIAKVNGGFHEHVAGGEDAGDGLTKLPMENGDICEGGDGNKQRFDGNHDNTESNFELGALNMRKHEGGREVQQDEKEYGGVNGIERCVDGGDYNSQRKDLKYDSLDSKKREIDKLSPQVYRVCKNGDADEDNDRDIYFRRANEDKRRIFGRNGGKIASERGSRHAHEYDPVSLDLDKHVSVQISDSVEDSLHEVSECDSDGTETSDDTYRRYSSSMCTSSSVPHDPGSSCSLSPCASLSDDDIDKCHKHSKNRSSSLVRDFEEEVTREYHPFKDSTRHHVKQKTGAGRYCERQRGLIRKDSNQSNDMPDWETHLTDEDASYVSDVKCPYNRYDSHGKPRSMLKFDSNKKDMPYCNQSVSYFNYSNGFVPHDHVGPAYLKNQYWNIHPSFKYKADGRNMSERRNTLMKSCKMDYKALEDEWYHNKRRHVQGNSEQSRKVIPKYSYAVGTRGNQFSNRGDALHFRRKTGDYSSPPHDYDKKFINGKYRRFMPIGDRQRDQPDRRYDQNIAHDRREIESSKRGKRRSDNSLDSSHNLRYIKTVDHDRRYIKHRPESGISERNMRRSWKEMDTESGQYGTNMATTEGTRYHHSEDHHVQRRNYLTSTNSYVMNGNMKDHHDQDNFLRRRHHQQFKVLRSRNDVYKSRHQDDTKFHSEGPSYHSERISRINMTDDRHAFGHVAELIDERDVDRHRFKTMREDHSNQFDKCHDFIQPHSYVQMHQRYRYSVDPHLVIEGKKCSLQIISEAGNDKYYGRHNLREWNDNQKRKDLDDYKPEKAVLTHEGKIDDPNLSNKKCHDTFSINQKNEFLDIEEGQIITEEMDEDPVKCGIASEDMTSNGNGVVEGLGDVKIREIMAKMEKRRERFKEPITPNTDYEKTSNHLLDLDIETAKKSKLERPARKRRWF